MTASPDGDDDLSAAPRNTTTDVVRTIVDHRSRRLVVVTRVQRLSRSAIRLLVGGIRTSDGSRYDITVDFSRRPLFEEMELTDRHGYRDVRCPGMEWSLDGAREEIRASIPRSCLSDPAWVRVGLGLSTTDRDFETTFADDSRLTGLPAFDTSDVTYGPRQPHL